MSGLLEDKVRFHNAFLLLLALAISALFLHMIWGFVMALVLAAIFAGLVYRPYVRLTIRMRGRKYLAAMIVLFIVVIGVVGPLAGLFVIVIQQAAELSSAARPWFDAQVADPGQLRIWFDELPFIEQIAPYSDDLVAKAGDLAGQAASILANGVAAATRGTAQMLISLFVMLYGMFFFLVDGRKTLEKVLFYIPLNAEDEALMLERFTSVTRATLQGTLVIGVVQGTLAGIAFAIVGLDGALFWATIMAVLSVIPGVGIALVWVPAVAYLAWVDRTGAAIGLALWCGLVAGMVDNVLRPRLVGQDTKMSDLLILVSTLGGLTLFGPVGIIIGPIIAACSVTVWELYGRSFSEILPSVELGPDELALAREELETSSLNDTCS